MEATKPIIVGRKGYAIPSGTRVAHTSQNGQPVAFLWAPGRQVTVIDETGESSVSVSLQREILANHFGVIPAIPDETSPDFERDYPVLADYITRYRTS